MFPFYTGVNVLFLSCEKNLVLLQSIGTEHPGTVDTRGTFLLEYSNSQQDLKSAKKRDKDLRKTPKSVSQALM